MEIEQPLCFLGALSREGSGSMLGGHMVERKEQMKSRSLISISPFCAEGFCSSASGYGSLHFPEGKKGLHARDRKWSRDRRDVFYSSDASLNSSGFLLYLGHIATVASPLWKCQRWLLVWNVIFVLLVYFPSITGKEFLFVFNRLIHIYAMCCVYICPSTFLYAPSFHPGPFLLPTLIS